MKEEGATQSSVRTEEEAGEPTVVRSGKWKIPSSKDYLDLFKELLDCENMKVRTLFCKTLVSIFNKNVMTFRWSHQICTSRKQFKSKSHPFFSGKISPGYCRPLNCCCNHKTVLCLSQNSHNVLILNTCNIFLYSTPVYCNDA